MKPYLYAWAFCMLGISVNSYADLDSPELQAKAGQAEMDMLYDITHDNKDLEAAKQFNQITAGEGLLSIELKPKQQLAEFNLTLPKNELTNLSTSQLTKENSALALWNSLFKFTPPPSCALTKYHVESQATPPLSTPNPSSAVSINWSLNCSELKLVNSLELKMFTPLAPTLHTIHADWLTPDLMGAKVLTLPTLISFDQVSKK
jgi:hypothetical protein